MPWGFSGGCEYESREHGRRQQLASAAEAPDRLHLPGKDLTGIQVKRHLDRLADFHILEAFLGEGGEQIAIRIADEGGDGAGAQLAGRMPG